MITAFDVVESYIISLDKSVNMFVEILIALSDYIGFQETFDKNIPDSNNNFSRWINRYL